MALTKNARKTEHNGAKNMGHCKSEHREVLKLAAKKYRRRASRAMERAARR